MPRHTGDVRGSGDSRRQSDVAHASKGLETEEVFIINPEKLPLVYRGQSEAQFEQELHLDYVARTRPIQKLTYVLTEPKD